MRKPEVNRALTDERPVQDERPGGLEVWTGQQFCEVFQVTPDDLDDWIGQGLKVLPCRDGSVRITRTALNEFVRGRVIQSPYFNTDEAALFCHLTKDAIYARVERKKLRPLPGSGKENLFTEQQLRHMMEGEQP